MNGRAAVDLLCFSSNDPNEANFDALRRLCRRLEHVRIRPRTGPRVAAAMFRSLLSGTPATALLDYDRDVAEGSYAS